MTNAPAQQFQWANFAGSPGGLGNSNGTGSAARFNKPYGTAVDSLGNVYVADTNNHTIRKITSAGVVTTLAGNSGNAGSTDGTGSTARFNNPAGLVLYGDDILYVADSLNATIRKVTTAGVVTTLAGSPIQFGSADGTGSAARFKPFYGITFGGGNIYVADTGNYTIRKITTSGVVTTVAGTAGSYGSKDDTGAAARFFLPYGLAVDGSGNIYVADTGNSTIRKISSNGEVTTLAGVPFGQDIVDGTGDEARFIGPFGIALGNGGHLFVSDLNTIRKVTMAGVVTTLAGSKEIVGSADGSGSAASFSSVKGVSVDGGGNIYVADADNDTIRKVTSGGDVTTLAGKAPNIDTNDGTGALARFFRPSSVAADGNGNIYVADTWNSIIRKISSNGTVTTLAGDPTREGTVDGVGTAARFFRPAGIAVDGSGNVYVADSSNNTIRKVTSAGAVTTLAGLARNSGYADGTGSVARFDNPKGIAVDGSGNVYVADSFNDVIRKINSSGVVTTFAGTGGTSGTADGSSAAARFSTPEDVEIGSDGYLYVADGLNYAIRKISSAGVVTTLAGKKGFRGSTDATGVAALFNRPLGIAVDEIGNVYVADSSTSISNSPNQTIRKVSKTGVVTTIGGTVGVSGDKDGMGTSSLFSAPCGIAINSAGNLFVADHYNNRIVKGTPLPTPPGTSLPVVAVASATSVGTTFATLNGSVDPKGGASASFQHGLTTAYGAVVDAAESPLTGTGSKPISSTITGLQPHTLYHFRVTATNHIGTVVSADKTFTTLNTAPVATTDSTVALPGAAVTINVLTNDSDDDGDTLKLSTVKSPAATAGTAKIVGSNIVFTAAATFTGTSFDYTISDGFGKTDTGTVTITLGTCTLSPDSREVPAAGTNYPVVVTANTTWSVNETLPWATVSQLSGSGNDAVQVTLLANTTKLSRRGVVIIGGKEHVILQAGTLGFTFEEPALAPVGMVCADYSLTMASPLSGVKFGASGLPSGLVINAITGEISGKPKVAGTFKVTITGTVAATGASTTIILIMTIQPLPDGAIGTFSGPVEPALTAELALLLGEDFSLGGRFELTTTSTGIFTGKFVGAVKTYSFSSSAVLHATVGSDMVTGSFVLVRIGRPPLQVRFTIDGGSNRLINDDMSDGFNIATSVFQAWRNVWNTPGISVPDQADLNRYLGLYTFALHVPTAQPALPQGSGYGFFTVAPKTGALTAAGKLADNTGFTYSTFARVDGEVFIFQPLYGGKGRILGTLDITPGSAGFTPPYGDNTLGGTVSWLRPAIVGRLYSSGFGPYNLTAVGGRYVPPAPATSIVMSIIDDLINNNSRLIFTGANIVAVNPSLPFRLKASSVYVKPASVNNSANTTLTVTPATGAFTGGFSLSESNPLGGTAVRPATYYGQIVRDVDSVMRGYGFYHLADLPQTAGQTVSNTNQQSGLVVLEKNP